MSFDRLMREEARLIILRTLEEQPDGRLNSELLRLALETFGISKSRDWVHDELNWLRDMSAVTLVEASTVRVAQITAKGSDHVARRLVIEGVKRPSRPGA
ncbi:VpaChn25_0724 family phage protein [Bosea thiooxidans]